MPRYYTVEFQLTDGARQSVSFALISDAEGDFGPIAFGRRVLIQTIGLTRSLGATVLRMSPAND